MRPLPELTPMNEWFWTSGADGQLRIQACNECKTLVHPPAPICPACRSRSWAPTVVSGRGDRRRLHGQPPSVAPVVRAALRDRRSWRSPRTRRSGSRRTSSAASPTRSTSARKWPCASSSRTTSGFRCSSRPAGPTARSASPSRSARRLRPPPTASASSTASCSPGSAARRSDAGSWSIRSRSPSTRAWRRSPTPASRSTTSTACPPIRAWRRWA